MPFGRNTRVVPSNTVLDSGGPEPPQEGEIWESEPPVRSDAAYLPNYFHPCCINWMLKLVMHFNFYSFIKNKHAHA